MSENIYDELFNIYLNRRKRKVYGHDTLKEYIFLNSTESLFNNLDLYEQFENDFHDVLKSSNKEYFIDGIKIALELLK